MARTEECILYRDFENGGVLHTMTSLMNSYEAKEEVWETVRKNFSTWLAVWWKWQACTDFPEICGTHYLTQLLVNHENAFSTASEIRGAVEGSINHLAHA